MTSALLAIGYIGCKDSNMAQFSTVESPPSSAGAAHSAASRHPGHVDFFLFAGQISLNRGCRTRAAIADSLLPRVWSAITNADKEAFEHHAFQIDNSVSYCFLRDLCRHLLRSAGLQRTQSEQARFGNVHSSPKWQ